MRTALAVLALAAPTVARADEPAPPAPPPETPPATETHDPAADGGPTYFAAPRGRDIVIESREDRSTSNITLLAALGGAGAITGAIGVYFNLDARSASDEVSANKFTGEVWNEERQEAFDRANRSSALAGVFYGIGGALLLATAITYIVTEPETEKILIRPHANSKPQPLVAPTPGGALLGGSWRF